MQSEIIEFNKKYKTVRVFFGGRFVGRSKRGLKWTTLDEYGMNNKNESKKNPLKPLMSKVKMDFSGLLWNLP